MIDAAGEAGPLQVTGCPGCGVLLPSERGPTHDYLLSSPACWSRFGIVLAREFGDPAYFGVHQLTVDSYAVQHPGVPERRSIQSVGLHLITLCMVIERDADPAAGPRLHNRIVGQPQFEWLEPPDQTGRMTVCDLLDVEDPDEHERLVRAWAADAWDAWSDHHERVRAWVDESGAAALG